MKRSLSLRREALAPIGPDALSGVVGAALPTTPVKECLQTTGDSAVVCTMECWTRGTSCAC